MNGALGILTLRRWRENAASAIGPEEVVTIAAHVLIILVNVLLARQNLPMHWLIFGLAYASLFIYGVIDNSRGPVFADLLKTFHLSDQAGSAYFFSSPIAALIVVLLTQVWLKRWGLILSFKVFTGFQLLALLCLGASKSYAVMLVGVIAFGVSSGGLGVLVNLLVVAAVPAQVHRRALAGLHGMYGLSSLIAPLLVTQWYRLSDDWWRLFWAYLPFPLAILFIARHLPNQGTSIATSAADVATAGTTRPSLVSSPRKIWFMALVPLVVVAEVLMSSRLALYVQRDLGLGLDQGSYAQAWFFLAMFAGRGFVALVHLRLSHARLMALALLASLIFFSLGLLFHPMWLSAVGFALGPVYPLAMVMISDEFANEASTIMAWCQTTQAMGLVIMHFGVGALSDQIGLGNALWLGPICLLVVLILLLIRQERSQIASSA